MLQLAVHFAVLHDEHTLDPARSGLPGREKAVRFGGAGTPLVTEFAAAAFGARLPLTPWAARVLIGDALDLAHRIKTFGDWQVQQPCPGIHLWRDPHGALHLVDHTGTRRLSDAA